LFYPAEPERLRAEVEGLLALACPTPLKALKALVAPHAGYPYSGPIAASAYAALAVDRHRYRRVVLLGTAHTAGTAGLVVSRADSFATPLGLVPVDREAVTTAFAHSDVIEDDAVHRCDHALEVQLPFLQVCLEQFSIVPLLVGRVAYEAVGEVLTSLWDGPETLVVVSSDLSHYHSYEVAQRLDRETAQSIETLEPEKMHSAQACGLRAIQGLLHVARSKGLGAFTLDLRSSGDTSDRRDRVVGYGAFAFAARSKARPSA
jgi:hypothetical protein